jgi:membrane-bound serine protease (ClpP class)
LGFLGLIIELNAPGVGLPGAVGLGALALFFGSHLLIGLAGLEALLLFVAGIGLLALEVFVVPGVGLLGILGAAGVLAGLYLSLIGQLPTSADFTRAAAILSAAIVVVVAWSWLLFKRLRTSRRLGLKGIFLSEDTGRDMGYESAARRDELVGREGVALTDLRPSGTGQFGDERIDVVSESEWVARGAPIRIVASEGYRHVVRPLKAADAP